MKNKLSHGITMFICLATIGATSCKKIIHSNAPTASNERLLGYNKITTVSSGASGGVAPVDVTESFRFYYDDANRVSQIVYTGNMPGELHKRMDFMYSNDTVYKVVTNVVTSMVTERDTFIRNSVGQLVTAYTPGPGISGIRTTFEYFGKLMARKSVEATNWNTLSLSSSATYSSVNGDLLKQTAEGRLNTEFYSVTAPYTFSWQQSFDSYGNVSDYTGNTYTFNTYDYTKDMYVFVEDAINDTSSLTAPAWQWSNESYHFYTEDANRVGDYLWLESLTMYGQNIYNNNHLAESIAAANRNAYITYRIDAESKITQLTATLTDNMLTKTISTYDVQYERY